jgi:hypothetical protein
LSIGLKRATTPAEKPLKRDQKALKGDQMLNRFNLTTPRRVAATTAFVLSLSAPALFAQDRDRHDGDRDRERVEKIEPGTTIAVRTTEPIDVEHRDSRVYRGVVDREVRGENGRLAIPRGAAVELIVRVAPDNDLILDLESVIVDGDRYGVKADADRVESRKEDSLVGAILGAVAGVEVRGRAVRVPRDSVLSFRIDRPMWIGAPGHDEHRDHDDHDRDDRR